ncbi:997_t:CDS:2, partial [Funneliformis geosporum]
AIERKLRGKEGHGSSEMSEYLERLGKDPYPEYVKKAAYKEAKRYEKMHPSSNEAYIVIQYVDCKETNDLNLVRQKLDEKHYNLTKAKDEIVWHLAAQQQADKPLGEILLLTGPAGVGKSSFALSVAEAMGRKFGEISLGGAYDVNLIQGFRRTYVGSMPGRLVQILKEEGVVNPVILIDEVDKVTHDSHRGSLLDALLAVLDSGRNKKFVDHYLEVPIDLSQIMFICTANSLDLPRPLLNRMKIIPLSSYTELEKFQIAQKYLIPNNLKKFNLQKGEIIFQDQAVMDMIKYYTWEAGVRKLNMEIQTIIKKFSEQFIKKEKEKLVISSENLKDYLGKRKHEFTEKEKSAQVEGELEVTGNLGDIMKESAQVAVNYIKSNQQKFGINADFFS